MSFLFQMSYYTMAHDSINEAKRVFGRPRGIGDHMKMIRHDQ